MLVEITGKIFNGRKAVTKGRPASNGFIQAFLVNPDGSVQNEYIYLHKDKIKKL